MQSNNNIASLIHIQFYRQSILRKYERDANLIVHAYARNFGNWILNVNIVPQERPRSRKRVMNKGEHQPYRMTHRSTSKIYMVNVDFTLHTKFKYYHFILHGKLDRDDIAHS